MPLTLEEQITALKNALATGEKVVHYNGKRVEYRDVSEILAALSVLQAELATTNNTKTTSSSLAYYGRGLE